MIVSWKFSLISDPLFCLSVLLFRSSTSKPLFFNGTSSSLQILGATVPLAQGFKFSFRTCKGGALLSQQGTPGSFFIDVTPGTMNFSTEAFVQSHLVFSWAVQQNVTNTITLGENLDKNLWYTVTFTPGSGNVNSSVSVSDGSRTFSALVSNQILNFAGSGPLFAGDAARGGFTGCIESGTNIVLSTASGSTAKEGCPLDSQPDCPARGKNAVFVNHSLTDSWTSKQTNEQRSGTPSELWNPSCLGSVFQRLFGLIPD